jgi:hypothetical protein
MSAHARAAEGSTTNKGYQILQTMSQQTSEGSSAASSGGMGGSLMSKGKGMVKEKGRGKGSKAMTSMYVAPDSETVSCTKAGGGGTGGGHDYDGNNDNNENNENNDHDGDGDGDGDGSMGNKVGGFADMQIHAAHDVDNFGLLEHPGKAGEVYRLLRESDMKGVVKGKMTLKKNSEGVAGGRPKQGSGGADAGDDAAANAANDANDDDDDDIYGSSLYDDIEDGYMRGAKKSGRRAKRADKNSVSSKLQHSQTDFV